MEEEQKKEEKKHLVRKGLVVLGLLSIGVWLHRKAGKIDQQVKEEAMKIDAELGRITDRVNVLEGKLREGISTNSAIWREIARKRGRKDLLS